MLWLGINQDRFDSGVCLCRDDELVFAANEERYTRQKTQGGFPHRALEAGLRAVGASAADVDSVCMAGLTTPPLPARLWPDLYERFSRDKYAPTRGPARKLTDLVLHGTPLAHGGPESPLGRLGARVLPELLRARLPHGLAGKPLQLVEHHAAHAAGALALSGFEQALCVTADGMGDGRSLSVSRRDGPRIERLWSAGSRDSLGLLFEAATEALGFIPCRHEGKLTGLAARGDATRVRAPSPFLLNGDALRYTGPHGLAAVRWLQELAERSSAEDLSAWLQGVLEQTLCQVVGDWLRRTGLRRLALAGGVFANVKLNQALHALPEVDELFVHPNMGDGGLSLGAVCVANGMQLRSVPHVMLGDGFDEAELQQALREAGLRFERPSDPDQMLGERLAAGGLVGRFDGRMEWGPRALGNRSILARSHDPEIAGRLNSALGRSDFMPFAPAVLAEDAGSYFEGLQGITRTAEFMTVCVQATARAQREHPAVVHVDGSARPQLVVREHNPGLHGLLSRYRDCAGPGMLLNTSFNAHEEPIVRTPREAVRCFLAAGLDVLALGPFLAEAPMATGSLQPIRLPRRSSGRV